MVDDGRLLGMLTEKDVLNRVLAKGLRPDRTLVGDVMTPNPDTVASAMTVLEALEQVYYYIYLVVYIIVCNRYLRASVMAESTRMEHTTRKNNDLTTLPSQTSIVPKQMDKKKYLHLPVVDNRAVVGVVNVMEIVQAITGSKGSAR